MISGGLVPNKYIETHGKNMGYTHNNRQTNESHNDDEQNAMICFEVLAGADADASPSALQQNGIKDWALLSGFLCSWHGTRRSRALQHRNSTVTNAAAAAQRVRAPRMNVSIAQGSDWAEIAHRGRRCSGRKGSGWIASVITNTCPPVSGLCPL